MYFANNVSNQDAKPGDEDKLFNTMDVGSWRRSQTSNKNAEIEMQNMEYGILRVESPRENPKACPD